MRQRSKGGTQQLMRAYLKNNSLSSHGGCYVTPFFNKHLLPHIGNKLFKTLYSYHDIRGSDTDHSWSTSSKMVSLYLVERTNISEINCLEIYTWYMLILCFVYRENYLIILNGTLRILCIFRVYVDTCIRRCTSNIVGDRLSNRWRSIL